MNEISFNLIKDPWLPCKMKSNEFMLLSIKDALFNAKGIIEITSDNPLIIVSLHRLLLAILHRNFGPKNRNEWKAIYQTNEFDQKILKDYFEDWMQKFELFNEPEHRFYQIKVPEIGNLTPVTKLNPALSSGNASALFDHNWDSIIYPMEVEKVARLLVAFQNFSLGGGKSIPFYYSSGTLISCIIVLLKGANLFETLMLNLIRYDKEHPFSQSETHEDIPFWERHDKSLYEEKEGRFPYGYLDYLTWQSRRVWLIPQESEGKITVKEMYMAQGEKLSDDWYEDPQKIYVLNDKNKRIPLQLRSDRKVWRDAESLLRLNKKGNNYISPKAVNWISSLAERNIIPFSKKYNMEIYGLDSNRAKVDSWHRSYIPLPLNFLKDQKLVNNVKSFIDKCEEVEKILVDTVKYFIKAYFFPEKESLNKNQWNKVKEYLGGLQIRIQYWNMIESYFYKFIEEIAQEPDYQEQLKINTKWITKKVIKAAKGLLNSIKENSKDDPRALKPIIQKFGYFFKNVQNIK